MNTNDVLTIVKHLANDRDPAWVAQAVGGNLTAADVQAVGEDWGWPDKHRLNFAVDELTRQAKQAERATIPRATTTGIAPRPATRPLRSASVTEQPVDQLLARADKLTGPGTAKVHAAAKRTRAAINRLEQALTDVETRKQNAARKAAEKARARAEVERLQRELAEAKARARGVTATTKGATKASRPASAPQSEAARIRTWAAEHGIDCPQFGRIPGHVREQYDNAQEPAA